MWEPQRHKPTIWFIIPIKMVMTWGWPIALGESHLIHAKSSPRTIISSMVPGLLSLGGFLLPGLQRQNWTGRPRASG